MKDFDVIIKIRNSSKMEVVLSETPENRSFEELGKIIKIVGEQMLQQADTLTFQSDVEARPVKVIRKVDAPLFELKSGWAK
jgi:hypothetical protein